ncbi:DinB family protein [Kribbella sp. NPDC049174]|uniref:DinB family protein n=1 Tax=Kribbella sp. NPDC049174 TaxID=3364112 RepID=UPI00371D39C4
MTLRLFRRVRDDVRTLVDGATAEELDRRLGSNSVGWLVWHISRGQDRNLSELTGSTQLWLADDWATRFDRPADPSDTGFGHSAEQAAAFRSPTLELLLAYHDATHGLAEKYLASAADDDLGRLVVSPTLGNTRSVEERLAGQLQDSFAHAGQIGLLRGL